MHTVSKIFGVLLTIIILLLIYVFNSPKPAAWLVHQLFKKSPAIAPENYQEILATTKQYSGIPYPSAYKQNTLDVISPKDISTKLPTIIWVHGGAFVGGDKSDVTKYAVQIASEGFHVVTLNYELAPSAKYPTPLLQLAEVYKFVEENAVKYQFDLSNIFFAGDSAGAQIAAQFVAYQTNIEYANLLGLSQSVPSENIKGVLLYCGPYNIQYLSHMSDIKFIAFLLNKVGWAYIGERNWQTSKTAQLASPTHHVTAHFPPAFITDGSYMSFEHHGKELADMLTEADVEVTTRFYERPLPHEYQFMMDREEAHETLHASLTFLQKYSK